MICVIFCYTDPYITTCIKRYVVMFQKISILLPLRFLDLTDALIGFSQEILVLLCTFLSKSIGFWEPLPLGISNGPHIAFSWIITSSCLSKYLFLINNRTLLIIWLAPWAGKMELSCPLGTTRRVPQEKFPWKPYNKSFIDQACLVKMAGTWPKSSHRDLTFSQ